MSLTTRVVLAALLAGTARSAGAAPCGAPDFLSALPRDGARSVPTNATLSAHYAAPATYDGEPIRVEHGAAGDARELSGSFDANEGLLTVNLGELAAHDEYVVTWPRLHGTTSGALGKGGKVEFVAGDAPDTEPPEFDGISSLDWDVIREHDDCTDSLEDRYAFDLSLGAARDDGGRDSLELVVFQSRSARGKGAEVLHLPIPPKDRPLRVERAIADATGSVCFSAIVRDLTGKFAGGDAAAVCTTTVPPPFFYGCRMGRHAPTGAVAIATMAVVAVAGLRRRRPPP